MTDGRLPDPSVMHSFWHDIWSTPVSHNEGDWISVVERACESIEEMGAISICPLDVLNAIRPASNWKSPGPDGLHNFWLKWLKTSHARLATQFQDALELGSLPTFMTTGVFISYFKNKFSVVQARRGFEPATLGLRV